MKQLKLSTNELYFLAWQMRKLNHELNNKYAKSIYDKAIILFDDKIFADVIPSEEFVREYECEWGSSKIEGTVTIDSASNDKYHKKCEDNYMNELLKKYGSDK